MASREGVGAGAGAGGVVVAAGSACVDYVGTVEGFPEPDQKVLTKELRISAGGNVLKALVCVCRLGGRGRLASKVGDDALGRQILKALEEEEGLETDFVLVRPGINTPFSYIIADSVTKSRTILHTPSEELTAEEVAPRLEALLADARLLLVDGRHGLGALAVAQRAAEKGIEIVMDCDKDLPGFDQLVTLTNYHIFNAKFLLGLLEQEDLLEAMRLLLNTYANCRFIISTLGERGCVLLRRLSASTTTNLLVFQSFAQLETQLMLDFKAFVEDDLEDPEDPEEKPNTKPSGSVVTRCLFSPTRSGVPQGVKKEKEEEAYELFYCTAYPIDPKSIVDTTGAGDVFIGSVCYGLSRNLEVSDILKLACFQAAHKCTASGSSAIPILEQVINAGILPRS